MPRVRPGLSRATRRRVNDLAELVHDGDVRIGKHVVARDQRLERFEPQHTADGTDRVAGTIDVRVTITMTGRKSPLREMTTGETVVLRERSACWK